LRAAARARVIRDTSLPLSGEARKQRGVLVIRDMAALAGMVEEALEEPYGSLG
jgi:hypothetical protein